VVDFLKNPDKYNSLGAKIPKGCLLVGPPGTGKTLLARAVAGEAGVPFFSCAASEFVEMFVGVGASRVRDLFAKAKKAAPCIVFIDELDAVGRQRGTSVGGGSDEREQTINQLLSEMDGFEGNTGVIVLSATNRPDVLDAALLRPGRFDRRITVDLPDLEGRVAILRIYAANKPIAPDVDLRRLARRTPGFSGADLQNLLNEAAITAARRGKAAITSDETADALDKIAMGPEKANALTTPAKKRLVAYHEAGHAVVGALLPDYDAVEKISIIPRAGGTGGVTAFVPDEERLSAGFYSRSYLLSQLSVALGGRAAEELVYGADKVTTGAASDLRAVTQTARMMVEQAGLSRRFTHAALRTQAGPAFLGRDAGAASDISVATMDEAAAEARAIVEEAYRRALRLLTANADVLHKLAERLVERESVEGAELEAMLLAEGAEAWTDLRVAAEGEGGAAASVSVTAGGNGRG
jgi:cell division protease FtsH